jgi:S-adenosylmethionine synthetase
VKQNFMFTSESVTEGHPDKLCDQIADAIVDRFLQQDPLARVVAECAVAKSVVFVAARFAADASVDCPGVARRVITQIGYDRAAFDAATCSVLTSLLEMPRNESCRFDERTIGDAEIEAYGADNQVTVFGFACDQTAALLPLPIWLAHRLARRLTAVRVQGIVPYLGADAKTQVGVVYRDRRPAGIHSITLVASIVQDSAVDAERLRRDLLDAVIGPVFRDEPVRPDAATQVFVNPQGMFVGGGPALHSGLTGRKNAIDTYGEYARHSGAALSGKDPLRIDRSGAYAARHAAKNVVAAGLATECEVQLSYTIGQARPVSVQIETFGTGRIPDDRIALLVGRHFELRPAGILRAFSLRRLPSAIKGGFYRRLAAYGHVGRMDIGLPWEVTDKVPALREEGP